MECDSIELSNFISNWSLVLRKTDHSVWICANLSHNGIEKPKKQNHHCSKVGRSIKVYSGASFSISFLIIDHNFEIRFLFHSVGSSVSAWIPWCRKNMNMTMYLKIDLNACFRYYLSNEYTLGTTKLLVTKFISFFSFFFRSFIRWDSFVRDDKMTMK